MRCLGQASSSVMSQPSVGGGHRPPFGRGHRDITGLNTGAPRYAYATLCSMRNKRIVGTGHGVTHVMRSTKKVAVSHQSCGP